MKKWSILFLAFASTLSYAREVSSSEIITTKVVETEMLKILGTVDNKTTLSVSGENALLSFEMASPPQYSIRIYNYSTLKVENGGSINMNSANDSYGNIQLNGYTTFLIESTAGTIYTDKIAFASANCVLTINKANAIQSCSADVPYVYLTLPSSGTLNLNASHAFNMDIRAGVVPTFKFANGAVLSIMGWKGSAAEESMKLVDFVDYSIFLSDGDKDDIVYALEDNLLTITQGKSVKKVSILDADGSAFEGLALHATEGGYFLASATAVPEPAEWAMIFGGIALAFAIYRRRK